MRTVKERSMLSSSPFKIHEPLVTGVSPRPPTDDSTRNCETRGVKNQRLASAGYVWAFAALTASPGARAHYDRRKAASDRHVAAQRNLFNRLLGCLHHCLHTRQTYDEATAFPTTSSAPAARAA
jgi:hypothetical protein